MPKLMSTMAGRRQTHALEINEILFLVGNFVPRSDLKTCSLVSRRWHFVFAPPYWRTVFLKYSSIYQGKLRKHQEFKREQLGRLRLLQQSLVQQDSLSREEPAQEQRAVILDLAAEEDMMDREFYLGLCKATLTLAQKMDAKDSKDVVTESFLGLLLLAGQRKDIRRLSFKKSSEETDLDNLPLVVPAYVFPRDRADLVGSSLREEWQQELVQLRPKRQTTIDLIVAVVEQNRDLETLLVCGHLEGLMCRWTKKELQIDRLATSAIADTESRTSRSGDVALLTQEPHMNMETPSLQKGPIAAGPYWPKLKSVQLQSCVLHSDFLRVLLHNAPAIERLWLARVTIDRSSKPDLSSASSSGAEEDNSNSFKSTNVSILGDHVGQCLRTLGICGITGISLDHQLRIAKQFSTLESLTLSLTVTCDIALRDSLVTASSSSYSQATSASFSQSLHKLDLIFPKPNGDIPEPTIRIAHILSSIPSTQLHDLSICHSLLQQGDLTTLIQTHASWLQTIEMDDCNGLDGLDILKLLQLCKSLRTLRAPKVRLEFFLDSYDLQQEWECRETLKNLSLSIECSVEMERRICVGLKKWAFANQRAVPEAAPTPAIPPYLVRQRQLFDRIATLSSLQILDLTCAEQGTNLEFSLSTGLDCLSTLKDLQHLDMRTRKERGAAKQQNQNATGHRRRVQRMSRVLRALTSEEARWMAREWPRLKSISGLVQEQELGSNLRQRAHLREFMMTLTSLRPDVRLL